MGFARKSSTPISRPRTRSATFELADRKTNGIALVAGSPFSFEQSAKPSTGVIFVSERMRSGAACAIFSRASAPLRAVETRNPALRRLASIRPVAEASGSTSSR